MTAAVCAKSDKQPLMNCVQVSEFCSVCLDVVGEPGERSIAKLKCGHQFHLDCIGSAFNAKGAMQCPNCRHVENGQWLYANGCRPFEDIAIEEVNYDAEYDLYAGIPDLHASEELHWSHLQWCPYQHVSPSSYPQLQFSVGEVDGPGGGFPDLIVNVLYGDHGSGISSGHGCPHLAALRHTRHSQVPEDPLLGPAAHAHTHLDSFDSLTVASGGSLVGEGSGLFDAVQRSMLSWDQQARQNGMSSVTGFENGPMAVPLSDVFTSGMDLFWPPQSPTSLDDAEVSVGLPSHERSRSWPPIDSERSAGMAPLAPSNFSIPPSSFGYNGLQQRPSFEVGTSPALHSNIQGPSANYHAHSHAGTSQSQLQGTTTASRIGQSSSSSRRARQRSYVSGVTAGGRPTTTPGEQQQMQGRRVVGAAWNGDAGLSGHDLRATSAVEGQAWRNHNTQSTGSRRDLPTSSSMWSGYLEGSSLWQGWVQPVGPQPGIPGNTQALAPDMPSNMYQFLRMPNVSLQVPSRLHPEGQFTPHQNHPYTGFSTAFHREGPEVVPVNSHGFVRSQR